VGLGSDEPRRGVSLIVMMMMMMMTTTNGSISTGDDGLFSSLSEDDQALSLGVFLWILGGSDGDVIERRSNLETFAEGGSLGFVSEEDINVLEELFELAVPEELQEERCRQVHREDLVVLLE